MDENPYEPPPPLPGESRKRWPIPWLLVGLMVGFITMIFTLPIVSDSTGNAHTGVILVCLIGGPLLGWLVGESMR